VREGWTEIKDPGNYMTHVTFAMSDKLNVALPPREVMRIVADQVIQTITAAWLQEYRSAVMDELRLSPLREEITSQIARHVADDLKAVLREALGARRDEP
jgi:hypothetical protein